MLGGCLITIKLLLLALKSDFFCFIVSLFLLVYFRSKSPQIRNANILFILILILSWFVACCNHLNDNDPDGFDGIWTDIIKVIEKYRFKNGKKSRKKSDYSKKNDGRFRYGDLSNDVKKEPKECKMIIEEKVNDDLKRNRTSINHSFDDDSYQMSIHK